MAQSFKRFCSQPGCPAKVERGACEAHGGAGRDWRREDRARGSRHERGYGAAWDRLRAVVRREEPLCRVCLAKGRVAATAHVDHIKPKAAGGTDERANLQGICAACHAEKSGLERRGLRVR